MAVDYQYGHFRSMVPENQITVGPSEQRWRYYDHGPKSVPPVIFLGGVGVTADVFYRQLLTLAGWGYRGIAVDYPALWTHKQWLTAFDHYLDVLRLHQVHLYGMSLGGFLAQLYCQHRPRRVLSVVLSNTFLDTRFFFQSSGVWSKVFAWAPDFVLKRLVLSGLHQGPHEALTAESIDFVVAHLDKLGRAELAARLSLKTEVAAVGRLTLSDVKITVMDSLDCVSVPPALKDAVFERYPNARRATLKSGGEFPSLCRADEVGLHLVLHLRHVHAARVACAPDVLADMQLRDVQKGSPSSHWDGRGGGAAGQGGTVEGKQEQSEISDKCICERERGGGDWHALAHHERPAGDRGGVAAMLQGRHESISNSIKTSTSSECSSLRAGCRRKLLMDGRSAKGWAEDASHLQDWADADHPLSSVTGGAIAGVKIVTPNDLLQVTQNVMHKTTENIDLNNNGRTSYRGVEDEKGEGEKLSGSTRNLGGPADIGRSHVPGGDKNRGRGLLACDKKHQQYQERNVDRYRKSNPVVWLPSS
eukprot:jgi/Mesen1/10616/ME000089S10075